MSGSFPKNGKPKILIFDIEVSAILAESWGPMWEASLIKMLRPGMIMSYSAKWFEGKHITKGWPDYRGYKKGVCDDKAITKDLWDLLNEADAVVTQNGKAFDTKYVNSRFIAHKLKPPSPYKVLDTKTIAKKYLRLPSYSLDAMCEYFGIGKKQEHEGYPLWTKCMAGDLKAWKRMLRYNRKDVLLTEALYLKLRPWIQNHPNFNLYVGEKSLCPNCGSDKLTKNGVDYTRINAYQQYRCSDCGHQPRKPMKGTLLR